MDSIDNLQKIFAPIRDNVDALELLLKTELERKNLLNPDIEKALELAKSYHSTQLRKSGELYITHPLRVAFILAYLGFGSPYIEAALLHDTLEDTALPKNIIKNSFSKEVYDMVTALTFEIDSGSEDSENKEFFKNYQRYITSLSNEAKIVKFCDMLDNSLDLSVNVALFDQSWVNKLKEKYFATLNSIKADLPPMFDNFVSDMTILLKPKI